MQETKIAYLLIKGIRKGKVFIQWSPYIYLSRRASKLEETRIKRCGDNRRNVYGLNFTVWYCYACFNLR